MAVLIRTIGKREYAYLVRRSGGGPFRPTLGPRHAQMLPRRLPP